MGQWLRGPLRDWAEALLNKQRLEQEGYFNSIVVRHVWSDHLQGKCDHARKLWGILMFQAWLEKQ
ncbi:asparagine synthase-related protein [Plesiomonas shigelloides subsp. oncorhynchi]|nr:asparagine synthase-related protein [Plesiomonas shigelloides]